jgi:hypothetical protein
LALQGDAFTVEAPRNDHPAQELSELRGLEADHRIAHRRAVGSDDAPRLGANPERGRLILGVGHG